MPRTTLSEREIAYLESQFLGRIATADPRSHPRVVPTGFVVDTERGTIQLGGHDLLTRKRADDIRNNPHVAFVVDDILDPSNWTVRGVNIRGTATLHQTGEPTVLPPVLTGNGWMEIRITSIHSWGLDQ